MFALFVLFAVASAYDYLISDYGIKNKVLVLDKCWNYKEDGIELSLKIIKNGDSIKTYFYSKPDCEGQQDEDNYGDMKGRTEASELPDYLVYIEKDDYSNKCDNAKGSPEIEIYLEGCFETKLGIVSAHYQIVIDDDDNILTKYFKDADCEEEITTGLPETDSIKCDMCLDLVTSSKLYTCGSISTTIIVLLMIFAFLF